MIAASRQAPPPIRAVVLEQARVTWETVRVLVLGLAIVIGVFDAMTLFAARRSPGPRGTVDLSFAPEESIILVAVALVLAILAWQHDNVANRAYHWTMPLGRRRHAITRLMAGWFVLLAVTAAFLVNLKLLDFARTVIAGVPHSRLRPMPWHYCVPFTAASISYVLASAASLRSPRPVVWVLGVPALVGGAIVLLPMLGFPSAGKVFMAMWLGPAGLSWALGAQLSTIAVSDPAGWAPLQRWLVATAIWSFLAGALTWAALRRHVQSR